MHSYRLRADVQHCQFGAQTVCLDLSTSRYFLLEGAASGHLARFVSGTATDDAIGSLLDLGLIEAGTRVCARPRAVTPTKSFLDHRQPKASPWLLYRAIREQRRTQSALLRMSLGALLEPTGLPRADPESCHAVAAAFARASRYRDATDQCLVRGLPRLTFVRRIVAGPLYSSYPIRRNGQRKATPDRACRAANSRTRQYFPASPSRGSTECGKCASHRSRRLRPDRG